MDELAEAINRIIENGTSEELEILSICFENYNRLNLQYNRIVNMAHNQNKERIDYSADIEDAKRRKEEARKNLVGNIQLLNLKYPKPSGMKRGQ